MNWRYIPFSKNPAAVNMGIDESILTHIFENKSPPTFRLYGWKPSAVTLGTFQCRDDEVDMDAATAEDIDVVRRITGGGAVYHDTDGEITYSIIGPVELFNPDLLKSYEELCGHVVEALGAVGITAVFKPINDILVNQKKISGNAQTRRKGILLQHGTILYTVDVDKMFSLLKVGKAKVSDKFVQSVKKIVTSVVAEKPDITKETVISALQEAFLKDKEYEEGALSVTETELTQQLTKEKYSTEEWNDGRK